MASVVAASSQDEEALDLLSELPSHVLLQVLRWLSPEALLRLAACSHKLHDHVTQADEVWQALYFRVACSRPTDVCSSYERSWSSGIPRGTFFERFLHWKHRLCRDCQQLTPYVFPLLDNRRLCTSCEASDPKYSLVTLSQALEWYGITADVLAHLPRRELKGLLPPATEKRLRACGQATLFLRSAVEALSKEQERAQRRGSGTPRSRSAPRHDAAASEETFQLDEEVEATSAGGAASDTSHASSDDEGQAERVTRGRPAKLTPEEAKAARKAAKAAVKAANRAKRASWGAGSTPHGGAGAAHVAMGASPVGGGAASSAALHRSGSGGQREVRGGWGRRDGGATWSRSYGTSPPVQSGPRARALVDDALGEFAISGLELAT